LGLTLEESIDEENDLVEKIDGLVFTYLRGIAPYVNGKVIDYHTGPERGFSINSAQPGCSCDGCSC
jgi:Fe-S cluster assembly iron-binding protein IscA